MERNYISAYRKMRGIKTQEELARKAKIPRSTLGEIERHKMRGDPLTLSKIAAALSIMVDELYISPNCNQK